MISIIGMLIPMVMLCQEDSSKYVMVELSYMQPKIGMEHEFVKAVHAHNKKFHAEAPYNSSLWRIAAGADAGWFVWTMGPLTFSDIDNSPGLGDHAKDWSENVAKYIEEYGVTEYWTLNEKMSVPGEPTDMFMSWGMGIEEGQYYRFKAFMEKILEIYKTNHPDEDIELWNNNFASSDEPRQVALNWNMDNWAEFDKEDWDMGEEYDEMFGPGSWANALNEWRDITFGISRDVWIRVKPEEKK